MGFKIHSSAISSGDNYSTRISEELGCIQADDVCGVVLCGISDNSEYHEMLHNLKAVIYKSLGRQVPVTLIPQYLLPMGGLSLEVYTLDGTSEIRIHEQNGVCYGIMHSEQESLLFIEGIPASDFTESICHQSREVFGKLNEILSAHNFRVDDMVRQWNYIGSIVSHRGGKQNYQEFNDARTNFYKSGKWHNGYPAATGIGTAGEGIIVGGIAFKKAGESDGGIYPIDNPLQVAAHVYSKQVLIDDDTEAMKSTPKFERAKLIESKCGVCCFVSGTAAIRGEESMEFSSARQQTIMTIENIEHLVSADNLAKHGCPPYNLRYIQLQVFIKNEEDYDEVKRVVEERFPQVSAIYTIADVCRKELLVEIESILTI